MEAVSTFPDRLRQAMARAKISQSKLARTVGIKQPSVNFLLKPGAQGSKHVAKIANVLKVNVEWLADGVGDMEISATPSSSGGPPGSVPITITDWPRDLPVYGTAEGGDEAGDFSFNGTTIATVRRPPPLMGVGEAFAIYVDGESMAPKYEQGDIVCIHPHRKVRAGDYVVVEMHGADADQSGASLLKRLVRLSGKTVTVEQFNPPKQIKLNAADIKRLWRVVTETEMIQV